VEDGDVRRRRDIAAGVEARRREGDVVHLPFSRGPAYTAVACPSG
jgi:hypothetical protein